METAKVDIRKLQLLNDRINQMMEVLTQVRLSVHGIQHTPQTWSPQASSTPYGMPLGMLPQQPWQPIAQPFVSPYGQPFGSPIGQQGVPQIAQQIAQQVMPQIAAQVAQQIAHQVAHQVASQGISPSATSPFYPVQGANVSPYAPFLSSPFAGQGSPSFGSMVPPGGTSGWGTSLGAIGEQAFPFLHAQQTPMSNGSFSSGSFNSAH